MKKRVLFGLAITVVSVVSSFAQSNTSVRSDRVIVTNTMPTPVPQAARTPLPTPMPFVQPRVSTTPIIVGQGQNFASNLTYKGLSFSQIKSKLAEAKRYLQTKPLTTASSEPVVFTSIIRVAYYDTKDKRVDSVVMTKDQFLMPDVPTMLLSAAGQQVTSRTIRGNGVNTPVVITDINGEAYLPLVVQYPRENRGVYQEMAYYTSTHPGLVTPEVVSAGRFYVHNVIEIARDQLRNKGYFIQPKVADIAERLSTVEHVDHLRFRTEFHPNIYNDIFTLYALNEGNTYRYSVSSAGAGGMVQMIGPTYRMVRERFPNAGLMPDFVEGMRNHVNATQAMLLYMQMTWNDLSASPVVSNALLTGIATQEHLMAAGYNSNPAKLPGYISRGGENWRELIPRETKIYLQIWNSLESAVAMAPRKQ
ncbi:MAG TPA: hypothetical protein PLP21_09465 [Pyrinomonadaceae bacterium]|nr:hypothetical protein [Acidobacteriota bacterium]HQZ96534.1 hypothetical protein [Pyrinomonadaceae bacterium]